MSPKKILIVDDEATITRLLKLNLEQSGRYVVRTENAGSRAYAAARQFRPDLVLLDLAMPDMEGGEVAAQIQADPQLGNVPIVFLTAVVLDDETQGSAGLIGGFPWIAKPINVQGVMQEIERQLARAA